MMRCRGIFLDCAVPHALVALIGGVLHDQPSRYTY